MPTHAGVDHQQIQKLPTVAICGPRNCGKDTAAGYIDEHTPLRFEGSLSKYLAPYVAGCLGLSIAETLSRKREFTDVWQKIGIEIRQKHGPLVLVTQCLRESDLIVGSRDILELAAIRCASLVDLVVWIDRDVPEDPTLNFGPDECDIVISNRGSIESFQRRLTRLFGRFAGVQFDAL